MSIAIVGEAWGEKEEDAGRAFVGTSGWLLNQVLGQVGIVREDCLVTNVFNLRPARNDIASLCGPAAQAIPGLPPLQKGKYVDKRYAGELDRLFDEIRVARPNLILALGATATWALCRTMGIKQYRGAVTQTHPAVSAILGRTYKVLPTYHPAMVLRDWSARPVFTADVDKAKRESAFAEVRRPVRHIWTEPTILDLAAFERDYIEPCERMACDIETQGNQITCIGFSPSPDISIVIPFFRGHNQHYWEKLSDERLALDYARRWLEMRPAVFQNGLYDMSFLWRHYGIPVRHDPEDTMLMHHAWQPELEKGLGFLATIYTDEASWKFMRKEQLKHD